MRVVPRPEGRPAGAWPQASALETAWNCLESAANACAGPEQLPAAGAWFAATVPGTVAQALRAAGRWRADWHSDAPPLHEHDYWYHTRFAGSATQRLRLNGLASIAEVWLNGVRVLESRNMFVSHDLDVPLAPENELYICFRSLSAALEGRRGRVRWRPRMITPASLRWVRTTLLGHMPSWCPSIHAVGPWRSIELIELDAPQRVEHVELTASVSPPEAGGQARDGRLALRLCFSAEQPAGMRARMRSGTHETSLTWLDARTLDGVLSMPEVRLWWPHTHGEPALHRVEVVLGEADETVLDLGRVGFRTIEVEPGADGRGFTPVVNGVPVFCRGACWTSADLLALPGTRAAYRPWLELARAAGMNMVRIGGTMAYESTEFHALCDEYGILVWQDIMLANFDYPAADAVFVAELAREVEQFLLRTRHSPSLAIVCGGSEVEQQAAMLGLSAEERAQPLSDELLPALVQRLRPDVHYVANSPSGGALPFMINTGVSHYYGVGAYQRPLDDARRAGVRFTSECLGFSNVPAEQTVVEDVGAAAVHHPRWKAGVPRDAGASWDFEDVRDHYLRELYGVEPPRLRYEDPERYLDLSRAVVAELMSEVFSEWRRVGSSCAGGLVWQLQDLRPGAGWGLIDSRGRPKSAWHALRAVWQPVQLVITDEGLNGLDFHVINETARPLQAVLDISCLRDGQVSVAAASLALALAPHSAQAFSSAHLLARFFDITYAYRFGPPAHDVTIGTLRCADTGTVLAEAFHLPDRRALQRGDPGLSVALEQDGDTWWLVLQSRSFARWVHIVDTHFLAERDWFHLAPQRPCRIRLLPASNGQPVCVPDGEVRALNAMRAVAYRG